MSSVRTALEIIFNWLKLNQPSVASFPYPGLTLEEDTVKSSLVFAKYNPDIKSRLDLGIY